MERKMQQGETIRVDEPDDGVLLNPVVASRINEWQVVHTFCFHSRVEPIYMISRATYEDGTEEVSVMCQCGKIGDVAVGEPGPNGMEWSPLRYEELN